MTEQIFTYTNTDEKTIERIIQGESIHVNHMVLPQGESFPEHVANARVYMAVLRGMLTIHLNDRQPHTYEQGSVLVIQEGTKMKGTNLRENVLELLIFKAFAPKPADTKE
jgi:quercetin dioxygenase-like cupin family protein